MSIRKRFSRFLFFFLCVVLFLIFTGCRQGTVPETPVHVTEQDVTETISEDGIYTSKEDVSSYIYTYGHLPQNFITKKEAKKLGWSGGELDDYAYGKCIGGDVFYNREGTLPQKKNRKYYECDIDTLHQKSRGKKRMIYSDDGLIYYTEDHYLNFELIYGSP